MPFSRMRYEYKDDFEWVRVIDNYPERHRVLHFEDSIQGAISLDDHRQPVIEYISIMAHGAHTLQNQAGKVLVGGLGGCGLLHAVSAMYGRNTKITSVEINPRIQEIGQRFFRLDPTVDVVVADLRTHLNKQESTAFDLVLIDCYSATSIPPHLTSLECQRLIHRRLAKGGLAVFNLWDASCNELWGDQLRTLLQAFGQVWLVDCCEDRNTVVFAAANPLPGAPKLFEIQGKCYPLHAFSLESPKKWPQEVATGTIIEDTNLAHTFGAIGMMT